MMTEPHDSGISSSASEGVAGCKHPGCRAVKYMKGFCQIHYTRQLRGRAMDQPGRLRKGYTAELGGTTIPQEVHDLIIAAAQRNGLSTYRTLRWILIEWVTAEQRSIATHGRGATMNVMQPDGSLDRMKRGLGVHIGGATLPQDVYDTVKAAAKRNGLSLYHALRWILTDWAALEKRNLAVYGRGAVMLVSSSDGTQENT